MMSLRHFTSRVSTAIGKGWGSTLLALAVILLSANAYATNTPTMTPTYTSSMTCTYTPTPTPEDTATPMDTATFTATPTPSFTATPTEVILTDSMMVISDYSADDFISHDNEPSAIEVKINKILDAVPDDDVHICLSKGKSKITTTFDKSNPDIHIWTVVNRTTGRKASMYFYPKKDRKRIGYINADFLE